jgi:outer membrane protein assembly factor BamB
VATWDVSKGCRLATFETVLDSGGERLSISPRGDLCVAASYQLGVVAAYDASSGEQQWERTDLSEPQVVRFSEDASSMYCASDDGPCHVLDPGDGSTLELLGDVRNLWLDPHNGYAVLDRETAELVDPARARVAPIVRTTFAILDAAFGRDGFVMSESGGPVRCFDLEGVQRWSYQPSPTCHVLTLSACPQHDAFFGIERPYQSGGPKRLIRLDARTGTSCTVCILGSVVGAVFIREGTQLLKSDGALVGVDRGVELRRLAIAN